MTILRQAAVGLRALIAFTVLLGLAYPLTVTGVAHLVFPGRADGSMMQVDGRTVGSSLIGQTYERPVPGRTDARGEPLMEPDPRWFQPRPSAGDYDGLASGGSNLGPNSDHLLASVAERRRQVAAFNGVPLDRVPADAVTASGSGLDPHISTTYAELQVNRVARERGLDPAKVREIVEQNTEGRTLGFLGEPRVNVMTVNAELAGAGR